MATVSNLKEKVLKEFDKLCYNLFLGKEYNYDYILDMLNFLEIGSKTSNPQLILNFLLNE